MSVYRPIPDDLPAAYRGPYDTTFYSIADSRPGYPGYFAYSSRRRTPRVTLADRET